MDPLEVRRWLWHFCCIQGNLTQGHELLGWRSGSGPEIPAGIWQIQTWPCPGAEPYLRPEAQPLLPWVLVGSSHSIRASKRWSWTIALNSVCFWWVITVSPSYWLSLGIGCFTWRTILPLVYHLWGSCTAPWHPGVSPTGRSRTSALQNWVIKAGLKFFSPLVFSFYQRIVPVKSDFHTVAALVGLQGRVSLVHVQWVHGDGDRDAVQPWSWVSEITLLPVAAAPGVVRLDSSLAGEADRLPCEWGSCQPLMGSLKCLNSATDAFLKRPQLQRHTTHERSAPFDTKLLPPHSQKLIFQWISLIDLFSLLLLKAAVVSDFILKLRLLLRVAQ